MLQNVDVVRRPARPTAVFARAMVIVALAGSVLAMAPPTEASAADKLRAGAGRADITPPTGYYLMGWVRSDAKSQGQLTRLFARALVLERGDRKLALVATDLGVRSGGACR